jgi:hypothetical protein
VDELVKTFNEKTPSKFVQLLSEGSLNFAPTYRYEVGSQEIKPSKSNPPSYCDRVFFVPNEKVFGLSEYRSEPKVCFSDHIPICADFNLYPEQAVQNSEQEKLSEQKKYFELQRFMTTRSDEIQRKLTKKKTATESEIKEDNNEDAQSSSSQELDD